VPSYASVLTIQELAADGSTVLRAATLVGGGLPLMGSNWGFRNRLVTKWYAGNQDEATQQVMGSMELPSHWNGSWNRNVMGRAPSRILDVTAGTGGQDVVDPFVLLTFLEGIFRGGRRLRVTWACEQQPSGQNDTTTALFQGSLVREGRCEEFDANYRSFFDIEWKVTFQWVSRGKSTARVASPRDASIGNNTAAYVAALDAIIAANELNANTVSPSNLTLGNLEQLANEPTALASSVSRSMLQLENELSQIVSLGSTVQQQPYQVARLAIDHGRNAQAIAQSTYQTLSQQAPESLSTQGDVTSVMAAWTNFAAMQDATLLAAAAAWSFVQQVRQSVPQHAPGLQGELGPQVVSGPQTVQQVYLWKQGDTMHKVSQRFYGSPDHADDIARCNNLSWHTFLLTPGTILIIPVLSSTAQTV
jgi:hypothetical protein